LIALGVISSLLQLSFTFAYKFSDAVVVVTLRYLQVPSAGILGFVLFSEVPTFVQVGGATIVVTSCMFIVWREFVISRKQHDSNLRKQEGRAYDNSSNGRN
jgi:drug/metabolite transporter (DMT)-like permease